MAELTAKQRMAIPRQSMPEQEALERRANFFEVAQGLTPEMALQEAERCLQCKNEPCVRGCPVEVPIPQFIMALREGDMREAVRVLKSKNNLPAICGRVCPQESQCEALCTLGKRARAGGHWPAGALRGRLGIGAGRDPARKARTDGQARGGDRLWPGGPDLRGRPGQGGTPGRDL